MQDCLAERPLQLDVTASHEAQLLHRATTRQGRLRRQHLPFSSGTRAPLVHWSSHRQRDSVHGRATYADEVPVPYVEQEYTFEKNMDYWTIRPVTVIQRALQIGFTFSGWFLKTRLGSGDPSGLAGIQAERLREILTELGPAFVKIGQAVSSRPDFVPPSYSKELEKLQDKIPPFSDLEAMRILEEELGRPVSQVFSDFSRSSIAAASLGQVYKAKVRKTGQVVAVKVQRPNVRESIALDVFIMRYLVGRFGILRKLNSDLPSLLDEWAGSLFRELDYRREARNGTKFQELYSHLEGVYIPEMVHELTTRRVLTMEWVDGVRLRSAGEDASAGRALNPEDMKLVGFGVQCSLEQMLEDGFYHADPHPGNLLRTDNGKLGYLDFGMMASIEPKIRRGLIRATLHMVNREFKALAQDFETLGLLPEGSEKETVVPALSGVFERALSAGVSNMSFSSLSSELGQTMYEFKFRIPSYYTLLVRSLSVLEGIALSSDPNYKVLGAAYPWIARRLLTDSNPELQDTLKVLLYKGNSFQFSRLESLLQQALKSPARTRRGHATQNDSPLQTEKPLELLLGEQGSFVRGILVDELAKGVDAAWRMSADSAVQDFRGRLTAFIQGTRRNRGAAIQQRDENSLPVSLLNTLQSFPALANKSDTDQVEGINRLIKVMQEVRDKEAVQPRQRQRQAQIPSILPAQVQEAISMLQWFVNEVQNLSPYARAEALRLPVSVGAKLSSRIAARALKAFLGPPPPTNGRVGNGSRVSRSQRYQAEAQYGNAPATRFVKGTLQPASPPPSQPLVALGSPNLSPPGAAVSAEQAVSRPPGSQSKPGLSSEGGGLVTSSSRRTKGATTGNGFSNKSSPLTQNSERKPVSVGTAASGSGEMERAPGQGKSSAAVMRN